MEKYLFTIQNVEAGKLNALVNNIMKQIGTSDPNEAIRLVNSGEWTLSRSSRLHLHEEDVIRLSVVSDGTTGVQWIARLEGKGFRIGEHAKCLLKSNEFRPTEPTVFEVAVLRGRQFSDTKNFNKKLYKFVKHHKLYTPTAELACLIREKYLDKDLEAMGLSSINIMHDPIKVCGEYSRILKVYRGDYGSWLLFVEAFNLNQKDLQSLGLAFIVSKTRF